MSIIYLYMNLLSAEKHSDVNEFHLPYLHTLFKPIPVVIQSGVKDDEAGFC